MWKLIIFDDQHEKTVVNLVRDRYTIGRAEEQAVRLTERNISRRHATISRSTAGFRIDDHSSENGTFVNGVRIIGRQELAHGDLVQLGDYRIHVVDEAIETQEQGYRPYSGDNTIPNSGRLPHRLVQLIGPDQGTEFPLEGTRFLLGRGPECDYRIDHGSVSRVHAEVRTIGSERFEILDKRSANGLRINGHEMDRAILDGRDVIEVGDVVLKYIPEGQVFQATRDEGARIAALAGSPPPPAMEDTRTGLWPSLIAAGLGALLMAGLALFFLGNSKSSEAVAPSRLPSQLEPVAHLIESGSLIEAGLGLSQVSDQERALPGYRELERKWAVRALEGGSESPEERRKLLDLVAKRVSLPADLRKRAQSQLEANEEGDAIPLQNLEEEPEAE